MKKIAIIGAGIAGLTLANFLSKNKSYNFVVYERRSNFEETGAGIQLSPNAVLILNKLGFEKIEKSNLFYPEKINFFSIFNKKKITDISLKEFSSNEARYVCLKRSALVNFLKNKLMSNVINFNKEIVNIFQEKDKKIKISFTDNTEDEVDFLVGADGVFSSTRKILFNKTLIFYTGLVAYRGLVKRNSLNLFQEDSDISLFLGPNSHIVTYPVSKKKEEFNFVVIKKTKSNEVELFKKNWFNHSEEHIKILKNDHYNWNIDIKNIIDKTKDIFGWPIYETRLSDKWYKGNVILIGDAAHAMIPSQAQGAAQAIEDGFQLDQFISKNDLDQFSIIRKKRVSKIAHKSKINSNFFHISNPILKQVRNLVLKIISKSKFFKDNYLRNIYKI